MTMKTKYGNIRPRGIEEEMRSSYLTYAMTVIVGRALPDVRDGLKPVQRRILYAAHEMGMRPSSSYRKSARLVGDVLGKYHPHGEGAVYDAMVRLAQDFSLRVPLIDGQGNFGSVDNDPPAAMRYTEVRLSAAAEDMLVNLDQETVDFVENFDGTLQEPVVLPARLPNLLINGAAGIAVGMATNIPPHNPVEICDGVIHLIDNPEATNEDLMRFVLGPDFPTGATIMGREGIINAYTTGRGQIVTRAVAEIEPMKNGSRMQIIVTELPYQVNKAAMIERIASHIKSGRLEGISEIRDESDRQGMRVVMELRTGAQGVVILNKLYKETEMQKSFSANMMALVNGRPELLALKPALQRFIDFRREIVRRRTEFELRKAVARAHILQGLRTAIENLDAVIALIRGAADVEAARNGLMSRFTLDQKQAQAILDMQLRRLAALEREKIESEWQELQETIRKLRETLADGRKIDTIIKRETRTLRSKVDGERRTRISEAGIDFSREDLEPHEQVVITFSRSGYIKRIPAATFRKQHRGGKGVTGMNTLDDDPVRHILVVDTHDTLLFFTNRGRVYPLRAYELRPDKTRSARGLPVVNAIPVSGEESVEALVAVKSLDVSDLYLVMATQRGRIKRTALNAIANIRPMGLNIFKGAENDALIAAQLASPGDDVMMVSRSGQSIRFPMEDVTPRLRNAGGVKGMTLTGKDAIVSMDIIEMNVVNIDGEIEEKRLVHSATKLLVISKNGYGKLTSLRRRAINSGAAGAEKPKEAYRTQGRGGVGTKTMKVTSKTGPVAAAQVIVDSDELYVISEQAQVIRTSLDEISSTGRVAQGVRVFNLGEGDAVASIACVGKFDLPEEKVNGGASPKTPPDAKRAKPAGRRPKSEREPQPPVERADPEVNGSRNGEEPLAPGTLFDMPPK